MEQTPITDGRSIADILAEGLRKEQALDRARNASWALAHHIDMVERIDSDPGLAADRSIAGAKTRAELTATYLAAFRAAVAEWEALR